ncbi:MAG: thioredoxin family protein [Muribaculaceae bacterium]|nr:thioredoxin family protein [Muribaculaceae bacterium]
MRKTFEEVINETVPTLVVFQHAGHQDAVEVKYMFEELRKKYDGRANVMRVDASYNEPLWTRFQVHAFPTYILFKEGQELMRESGKKTIGELSQLVERGF